MKGVKPVLVPWKDVEIVSAVLMVYSVDISVEAAVKWLEGNTHNRVVKDGGVARYAHDIKRGRFPQTHQGIAFDTAGVLIDGQHRLYGILEANATARLLVFTGCPPETQEHIDQGIGRSTIDVMKLAGNDKVSNYRLSIVRRAVQGTQPMLVLTRDELSQAFEMYAKHVMFVTDEVFQKRKVHYVMPASMGAVILRASYHEDHGRLKAFGKIMLDGIAPSESDSYAIGIQRWLMNGAPAERSWTGSRDSLIYCKSQRALVGYINREISRNIYPMRDEHWMLPSEIRRTNIGSKRAMPKTS